MEEWSLDAEKEVAETELCQLEMWEENTWKEGRRGKVLHRACHSKLNLSTLLAFRASPQKDSIFLKQLVHGRHPTQRT